MTKLGASVWPKGGSVGWRKPGVCAPAKLKRACHRARPSQSLVAANDTDGNIVPRDGPGGLALRAIAPARSQVPRAANSAEHDSSRRLDEAA